MLPINRVNAFKLVAQRAIFCRDRTLFMLDCFCDKGLGRCIQAGLNKGEALGRASFMHRLNEIRDLGVGGSALPRHRR